MCAWGIGFQAGLSEFVECKKTGEPLVELWEDCKIETQSLFCVEAMLWVELASCKHGPELSWFLTCLLDDWLQPLFLQDHSMKLQDWGS
jgi:hypothetical protein